jgi:hypothetical protein
MRAWPRREESNSHLEFRRLLYSPLYDSELAGDEWIEHSQWRDQNPLPSHLANPQLYGGQSNTRSCTLFRMKEALSLLRYLTDMVGALGLEPRTLCLKGRYSDQLSYTPEVVATAGFEPAT